MKKYCQSAVLAGICTGVMFLSPARAQTNQAYSGANNVPVPPYTYYSYTPRFYVGMDVGGTITSDPKLKEFFGPVSPDSRIRLDPGVRLGFVGGYRFADWFSLEGETGVMANEIHSISGGDVDGASIDNVPFMANLRLQLPERRCPFTPFIGGGAGGSASIIDIRHHIDLNGIRAEGSDGDVVFAYQAFAGLRYAFNDNMGLGVEYHYFVTTGSTWTFSGSGTPSNHLKASGIQSHAITLAFDWRF